MASQPLKLLVLFSLVPQHPLVLKSCNAHLERLCGFSSGLKPLSKVFRPIKLFYTLWLQTSVDFTGVLTVVLPQSVKTITDLEGKNSVTEE